MSFTNTHDPALERGRLCVVIATIVINVIAVSLLTFAPWSDWRTIWKDEHMIDTLAVAYAETGDFNSAVQYASQALAVKGIAPDSTKLFQQHLALFQQHKPIPL